MLLPQFPDLGWLKSQIEQRFRNHTGYGGIPLETDGFPSVIIQTKVREAWRPDVVGPISLFLNLQGSSRCTVDNRTVTVNPDYFFLSNRFQSYTLAIESPQPVETFNIHIGEAFSEGMLSALLTPADTMLQNGLEQKAVTVHFHNQLYRKDAAFLQIIQKLIACNQPGHFHKALFEDELSRLLVYLLQQHRDLMKKRERMPALKPGTRLELFRRLSWSLDYLHAQDEGSIDLDGMAAAACLSKYHFLRLFRQTYRCTPYQYWQELRMQKAEKLLRDSRMSVQEIADHLGFENPGSFSRLFYQKKRVAPARFRTLIN